MTLLRPLQIKDDSKDTNRRPRGRDSGSERQYAFYFIEIMDVNKGAIVYLMFKNENYRYLGVYILNK